MDPLKMSQRKVAIREAARLYPDVDPVLAGWVFDYIQQIGEEEFERRIKNGYYEDKQKPLK